MGVFLYIIYVYRNITLEVNIMDKEAKVIDIKCQSHFIITRGGKPELEMHVDDLIDNDMFILTNTGRWYHHGGKQLNCISNDISIWGSRFTYEGEIHPGAGYNPEIIMDKCEAHFSIPATISNRITKDTVSVILKFVTSIEGVKEIGEYQQRLNEFNEKKSTDSRNATKIMDFLKS